MEEQEKEVIDKAFAFLEITDLDNRVKFKLSGIKEGAYYKYVGSTKDKLIRMASVRHRSFENMEILAKAYDKVKDLYGEEIIVARLYDASEEKIKNILEKIRR